MKFTKEEISLCKQVAEKYKKRVEYGDWYLNEKSNIPYLWKSIPPFKYIHKNIIPLWAISACLEFLRERCKDHVLLIHEEDLDDDEEWYLWFDEYKETQQWDKGKTPLEACLKVVLAVLEECK